MSVFSVFRKAFLEWEWICCFIPNDYHSDELLSEYIKRARFSKISVPKEYWAADPFLFSREGKVYCFFELFNKKKRKAAIGCKCISEKKSSVEVVYEFDGHSSYPCIFEYEGDVYMIPETKYAEKIVILKNVQWPNKWINVGVLKTDINAVDTTVYYRNKEPFVFIYQETGQTENILTIARIDMTRFQLTDEKEVMRYNKTEGRPAGNVLFIRDECIRVVQPANTHYGEKLQLYKFYYDGERYSETLVDEILPNDVSIIDDYNTLVGVHTLNTCDEYLVVDVLTRGVISLFRPIRWIFSKLGVFGYDCCDKKRERIFHETLNA